jgi:hypothetical protein
MRLREELSHQLARLKLTRERVGVQDLLLTPQIEHSTERGTILDLINLHWHGIVLSAVPLWRWGSWQHGRLPVALHDIWAWIDPRGHRTALRPMLFTLARFEVASLTIRLHAYVLAQAVAATSFALSRSHMHAQLAAFAITWRNTSIAIALHQPVERAPPARLAVCRRVQQTHRCHTGICNCLLLELRISSLARRSFLLNKEDSPKAVLFLSLVAKC